MSRQACDDRTALDFSLARDGLDSSSRSLLFLSGVDHGPTQNTVFAERGIVDDVVGLV